MRSAHIFLVSGLLATGLIAGCGTTGGTGGGIVGVDNTIQPTVTSFTISPKNVSRSVTQTQQFTVQAVLSTGQVVDATNLATFVSGNTNFVTVTPQGLATAVLPGTTTITASIGNLTDVANITVLPFVNRMFVSNSAGNTITVYDPAVGGAQTPLRTFAGNLTGLNSPRQMAVNGQELLVANSAGNTITVHSLHANGNSAPLRTIGGANTLLDGPRGLAVFNNEIYVGNFQTDVISVFPINATGNVAPTRTLGFLGAVNTGILGPGELAVSNGELTVVSTLNDRVLGFGLAQTGDVAPAVRNLNGVLTGLSSPRGVFRNATDLFISNLGLVPSIQAFAPAATGNTPPARTIPGLGALNTNLATGGPTGLFVQGNELFQTNQFTNTTQVFPVNTNGDVAPTRIISGSMNSPTGVLIAPSI